MVKPIEQNVGHFKFQSELDTVEPRRLAPWGGDILRLVTRQRIHVRKPPVEATTLRSPERIVRLDEFVGETSLKKLSRFEDIRDLRGPAAFYKLGISGRTESALGFD
jgi:hypothetical protein